MSRLGHFKVNKIIYFLFINIFINSAYPSSLYAMYKLSSYLDYDYFGYPYINGKKYSNQIGITNNYSKEFYQFNYGFFIGYIYQNEFNVSANVGADYLIRTTPIEYFLGAKIETPCFYKNYINYIENGAGSYSNKRVWIDTFIMANLGINIIHKIILNGQISYSLDVYSIGIGYKI